MRIGIIVLSIGNYGKKGYYNLQEVGLAKALDELCEEVKVYKLVNKNEQYIVEKVEKTRNTTITYLPSKQIGTNGSPNIEWLDDTLDACICFSDTQLMFYKVYRWSKKNNILLIPYIGVLESHSTSRIKRILMNFLSQKNVMIYRKCKCFAKTPHVQLLLNNRGIEEVYTIPVGLDTQLLRREVETREKDSLRKKYGYTKNEKIILFVGRMTEEKNPLGMIRIFDDLINRNSDYRLIMVGSGELSDNVIDEINNRNLESYVTVISRISIDEMWKVYTIADSFVNLNEQEIFGMAIMEAMYYGCNVVAVKAPGPNYIIENGISGCLVDDEKGIADAIENITLKKDAIHNRIVREFMWTISAQKMISVIQNSK